MYDSKQSVLVPPTAMCHSVERVVGGSARHVSFWMPRHAMCICVNIGIPVAVIFGFGVLSYSLLQVIKSSSSVVDRNVDEFIRTRDMAPSLANNWLLQWGMHYYLHSDSPPIYQYIRACVDRNGENAGKEWGNSRSRNTPGIT